MTVFEITSVVGLFVGPALAAAWTIYAQERQRKMIAKQALAADFLAVHDDASDPGFSLCLRRIPLLFARDRRVLAAWSEYKKNLTNALDQNSPIAAVQERSRLLLVLLREISSSVGWKLHESDIENMTYRSQGLIEKQQRQAAALDGATDALSRIANALENSPNAGEGEH